MKEWNCDLDAGLEFGVPNDICIILDPVLRPDRNRFRCVGRNHCVCNGKRD